MSNKKKDLTGQQKQNHDMFLSMANKIATDQVVSGNATEDGFLLIYTQVEAVVKEGVIAAPAMALNGNINAIGAGLHDLARQEKQFAEIIIEVAEQLKKEAQEAKENNVPPVLEDFTNAMKKAGIELTYIGSGGNLDELLNGAANSCNCPNCRANRAKRAKQKTNRDDIN